MTKLSVIEHNPITLKGFLCNPKYMTKLSVIEHNPITLKGFLCNPKFYYLGLKIKEVKKK